MELSTATKKKKRRTRKCLDELRKRSRRTMCTEYSENKGNNSEGFAESQKPRLITMNRLTLNMFPKAIRSEIITRPILEEIKHKSRSNIMKELNEIKKMNCIDAPRDPEVIGFDCKSVISSNNSIPMFDLEEETLHEQVSNYNDSPLRNNYMNSTSYLGMAQTPTEHNVKIDSFTTSLSSQTSNGDHVHELYEELMNKITSHLSSLTSAIVKEDVFKTTKVNLLKLYKKSWSKEYNNSMVEHEMNNKSTASMIQSPNNSIDQNPLNYLRMKHVQNQGMYDSHLHLRLSDVFSSDPSASAPAAARTPTPTPSPSLPCTTECTRHIAVYDTPEYNYYPHRLNQ